MAILNHIDDECIQDSVYSCDNMAYYQTVGAYLRGARKPHYPVPATPTLCWITEDCVALATSEGLTVWCKT